MGKYTTDPLRTGREIEKADELGTLGGEFGLRWNGIVPLTTGAHNAFLSALFEAGGVFDQLVDTFLGKITSASQLRAEQRWQLIIYWVFKKYRLIYRLYPPLLGDQIMLPLT